MSPINKAEPLLFSIGHRNLLSLCLNHKCQVRICFIWGRRAGDPTQPSQTKKQGRALSASHSTGLQADSSSGRSPSPWEPGPDTWGSLFECFPSYSHKLLSWGAAASLAGPQR